MTKLTFTFSKWTIWTIETIEKGLKYVQIKTRHWRRSGVFVFNFEHIWHYFPPSHNHACWDFIEVLGVRLGIVQNGRFFFTKEGHCCFSQVCSNCFFFNLINFYLMRGLVIVVSCFNSFEFHAFDNR